MLLRTLEIPDAHGQLLNAVVLCCFTAPPVERRFLVYSLNEKASDELVKIYLTSLEGDNLTLSMCDAPSETLTAAAQVLKDIFRDACSPDARQTVETYKLIDLTDTDILCSAANTHYNLKISDAWLMCLLHYDPQALSNTQPLPPEQTVISTELTIPTQSDPTEGLVKTIDKQVTSDDIEASLKSLIASVTNHKQILLEKHVHMEELKLQLEQREQLLTSRESTLIEREKTLAASIQLLQDTENQLNGIMKF
ncbi:hypothetical protein [Pseudomonas sp. MF7453]|uniref:hypothetical protein n=1 Tax=Pseudomonas sp. MF7453 TaxID=2797539 RepID=UPI0018E85FDC|nr:hypothetical protein [Pseudomonas sp. MF7453]MBJ2220629.1 hypothetical protein [Pseudomonas sp. MF7453]